MNDTRVQCSICRDDYYSKDTIKLCNDISHDGLCYQCAKEYISHQVLSSKLGLLSLMYCPSGHNDNKRRILNYNEYSKFIQPDLLSVLEKNSSALLSITCGGCHSLRSLAHVTTNEQMIKAKNDIDNILYKRKGKGLVNDFNSDLSKYEVNELNVDEFYQLLVTKYYPSLQTGSDVDSFNALIPILSSLLDPERRSTLHLRYLRDHPRVFTPCCRREHCFKCKTKEWHTGKTCEENTSSLAGEIIDCPSCNIYLTKSDGCNTVSCVCGKQFSWTVEKDICDRVLAFEKKYKQAPNIIKVCSQIICSENHQDLNLAKAYQSRHRVEVDRELVKIFERKYYPFPAAAICTIDINKLPEGMRECALIFDSTHAEEVAKYRTINRLATESIFLTYFPAHERAYAAIRILGLGNFKSLKNFPFSNDQLLLDSCRIWSEKNKIEIDDESKVLEIRNVQRLLQLYGDVKVSTKSVGDDYYCPSLEFNLRTSNSALTFSDGNTKVTRVGSISCYPAAFADLNSSRSIFTVNLDKCPQAPNWLTFGLSKKGTPAASSDGIGRSSNSWGICDDRGCSNTAGTEKMARICSNGVDVGITRKVKQGDVLECLVDCIEGFAEIYNSKELVYKFEIPCCSYDEYQFSMTFANDHSASIVSSTSNKTNIYGIIALKLNVDHHELYECFKRLLRSLLNNYPVLFSADFILQHSNAFESLHEKDDIVVEVQKVLSVIDLLLHKKKLNKEDTQNIQLSWKEILGAACYYHLNQTQIEKERMSDLSARFLSEHGNNSCFMAASILANKNEYGEGLHGAKAFVFIHPSIMDDWYNYNAALEEPLIGLFKDIGCCCLPRCTSSICSNSSFEQANKIKGLKLQTRK